MKYLAGKHPFHIRGWKRTGVLPECSTFENDSLETWWDVDILETDFVEPHAESWTNEKLRHICCRLHVSGWQEFSKNPKGPNWSQWNKSSLGGWTNSALFTNVGFSFLISDGFVGACLMLLITNRFPLVTDCLVWPVSQHKHRWPALEGSLSVYRCCIHESAACFGANWPSVVLIVAADQKRCDI